MRGVRRKSGKAWVGGAELTVRCWCEEAIRGMGEWDLGRRERSERGLRASSCTGRGGSNRKHFQLRPRAHTDPLPAHLLPIHALVGVMMCAVSRRRRKEGRTTEGCLRAGPSEASFGARGLLRSVLLQHSPACQPPNPARWPVRMENCKSTVDSPSPKAILDLNFRPYSAPGAQIPIVYIPEPLQDFLKMKIARRPCVGDGKSNIISRAVRSSGAQGAGVIASDSSVRRLSNLTT